MALQLINSAKKNFVVFLEFTLMLSFLINTIQFEGSVLHALYFVVGVMLFKMSNTVLQSYKEAKIMPAAEAKLAAALQKELFAKASEIDLECYDDPEYFNNFVWAMSQAFDRFKKTIETLDSIIGNAALLLMTGGFMLQADMIGLIFVIVSFGLTLWLNKKINKRTFKLDADKIPLTRKRDYYSRVFYLNDYSKELRLYNVKDKLFRDFEQANDNVREVIKNQTKAIAALTFVREFLFSELILVGVYMVHLLYQTLVLGNIAYGTMAALAGVVWRLRRSISNLTDNIPKMRLNSLYIDKFRAFLGCEVKITSTDRLKIPNETKTLELKDVSFSYNPEKPALNNVSMTINPGEKIAIVGYNGAGKTTLVKLLMRLYDTTTGQILYDGKPIQQYDADAYREMFGTVFQDYQLFAVSLEHNVAMQEGENDREKVKQALETAGFGERLAALPNGLDTHYTKEFNADGINYSMGEAQKIAISRTLYKNSRVIILDEPSSALDPIAEYNLNNTILNSGKDKTIIIISHRLSTTKIADRIYMFENGEIVEQGSHNELLELNGKYAEMFNLQSEKYQLFSGYNVQI
jgi:ATP-binding cassette subfamily B protein